MRSTRVPLTFRCPLTSSKFLERTDRLRLKPLSMAILTGVFLPTWEWGAAESLCKIRAAIGKKAGERVKVVIEIDLEERITIAPEDFELIFSKNKKAKGLFNELSYKNRKEYIVWITSAKKIETRERRLADTVHKLLKGLKNPSQKINRMPNYLPFR